MALNLRRGLLRVWGIFSVLWLALTAWLSWLQIEGQETSKRHDQEIWGNSLDFGEPSFTINTALLIAVSAPAISLVLGFTIMWIYRGFTSPRE